MKVSELYTYAPKSRIKAGQSNPNGKYQFYASSPDENRRCDEFLYDAPAIIMGTGGSATLHYYDGKFATSTDCLTLIPNEKVIPKYLYYFFLGNFDVLETGFKGAGLKHTNKGYIDNIDIIDLPFLGRQKEVVALFDRLNLIRTQRKKQIDELDNLIKARFVEMFGCSDEGRKVNIREVCDMFIDGDWIESRDQSEYGIRLIQTGNIGNGEYKNKSGKMRFISEDTFTRLGCTEVLPGDILISRLPDPVGRACVIPNGIGKMITAVDCTIVRLNKMVLPEYFIAFTDTRTYRRQIETYVTGSTRKRISRNNLGNISIPIAPIDKQNQFAAFVRQIDKSKFAVQNTVQDVRG